MRALSISRRIACLLVLVGLVPFVAERAAAQAKTPGAFYMEYRAAFDKAQKIEELLPYLAAKNRQQVEKSPADERVQFFEMIKMFGTMTNVKVLKEAKSGSGAMLTVEGMTDGKKQTGQVEIVSEGGAWKLGGEKWSGSM